jgi:hypothetical protein
MVVLGIIRYLAICKNYLMSKRNAAVIMIAATLIQVGLIIYLVISNGPAADTNKWICSINIIYPAPSFWINLWITIINYVYLIIIIFCYSSISIYYYKKLSLMESNYLAGQSNALLKKKLNKEKIITVLKTNAIVIIFAIQILPRSILDMINNFTLHPLDNVPEATTLFLINFFPLTNPTMILFFHEETFQEMKLLKVLWLARFKKLFNRILGKK